MQTIPIHSNPKGSFAVITIAAPADVQRQLDATHLPALINAFLETKRHEVSAKSLTNYTTDLDPFLTWQRLQESTILTPAAFGAFAAWLRKDWRNSYGKPATPQVVGAARNACARCSTGATPPATFPSPCPAWCPAYRRPAA